MLLTVLMPAVVMLHLKMLLMGDELRCDDTDADAGMLNRTSKLMRADDSTGQVFGMMLTTGSRSLSVCVDRPQIGQLPVADSPTESLVRIVMRMRPHVTFCLFMILVSC